MCSMIFSPELILTPKFFILNFHSNQIIKFYYIFRFIFNLVRSLHSAMLKALIRMRA